MNLSRLLTSLAALAAAGSLAFQAHAAVGDIDPNFAGEADNAVSATALAPDGKVLIGGTFTTVNSNTVGRFARLNANGSLDAAISPLPDSEPYVTAVQADGKILIGGTFTSLKGTTRNHLARLKADGSLDTNFNPDLNGTVRAIAIRNDGKIYVAGAFTMVGTTTTSRVVLLDETGALDATFTATVDGEVLSLAIQDDGSLLIGGNFLNVNSNAQPRLARLSATGAFDGTFAPVLNGDVLAIGVQVDGSVVIGGKFTTVNANIQPRLARLTSTGGFDASFTATADSFVSTLAIQADGKIVIGGDFANIGVTPVNGVARLNSTGTVDSNFAPKPNGPVYGVAIQPDGKIIVGGDFSVISGQQHSDIVRLENDAATQQLSVTSLSRVEWLRGGATQETHQVSFELSTDAGATWTSLGNGTRISSGWELTGLTLPTSGMIRARARLATGRFTGSSSLVETKTTFAPLDLTFNPQPNGPVYATAVQPDGKIIIAGSFTAVGATTRKNIARLNADGSLDAAFDPAADDVVNSVLVQPDGKIVIAGAFTKLGATTAKRIARLNADGSIDGTFTQTFDFTITTAALQSDGKILVGGLFTTIGTTSRANIARLNIDGSLDGSFAPVIDDAVKTIAIESSGSILVGGQFAKVASTSRNRIARLSSTGVLDGAFDPNVTGTASEVTTIAVEPGGMILIGGTFSSVGAVPKKGLARLKTDGTLDSGFIASFGDAQPNVGSVALQANGKILVAGRFSSVGGAPRTSVARLLSDGSNDAGFDAFITGLNPVGYSVALDADGDVLIGGDFTSAGLQARQNLARFTNDATAQSVPVVSATQLQWLRSGALGEVVSVTFEYSPDAGAHWLPVGDATRIAGGWEINGSSIDGLKGTLRARGRATAGLTNGSESIFEESNTFDFDTFTVAPRLTAPASGKKTAKPIAIAFTLPEPAAASSVTLKFENSGAGITRTLTLTTETAGDHSFSFDPTAPITSSSVASIAGGSSIPDGVYDVTLTYADAAGHSSASSATSTGVRIDTTNPQLSGTFSPLIFFVGPLPDYTDPGQLTVVDATSTTVTQSPAPGSVLPIGVRKVTLTATDAVGNSGSLDIFVQVRPLNPVNKIVRSTGQKPVDFGSLPNQPPSDAKLTGFGPPTVDDSGAIAYTATWTSPTKGKGRGLFSEPLCLATINGDVPTVAGAKFKSFTEPLSSFGRTAFTAKIAGPKTGLNAVVSIPPGVKQPDLLVRDGDTADGTGQAKFKAFKSIGLGGQSIGILAQLAIGTGTPKVTALDDTGIWIQDATHPLKLVLRKNQLLDTRRIVKIVAFLPGSGSPDQGRGWIRAGSHALALVFLNDAVKSQAVIDVDIDGTIKILSETGAGGDGPPDIAGANFISYGVPAANVAGQSAFLGSLAPNVGGILPAENRGIFENVSGGTYTTIARVTKPLAPTPQFFTQLKDPVLAPNGSLAFLATIKGTAVKPTAATTLWWRNAAGTLGILAQVTKGNAALPAKFIWKSFNSLAIEDRGPIFSASLATGKNGVTAKEANGLWAVDFNGTLRTLFRTNDTIEGRVLSKFTVLKTYPGSVGSSRSASNSAQVVWLGTFNDRGTGIVLTDIP